MRLIDADKLKEKVCADCAFRKGDLEKCRVGCTVIQDIDNAETIEPKKGKWIYKSINGIGYPHCSECGCQLMDIENFCPDCGVDMREERV